jgi:hypothetical protein
VQRMIPGRSLEETDPAAVGDATLAATWQQVARLHEAGIAHGDLGRHSVLVDPEGRPWLVDFDHAEAAAPEALRQADLAELLVGLAVRFGAARAMAGARDAVGREALAAALAATAPAALSRATRRELQANPGLWEELARLAAEPVTGLAVDSREQPSLGWATLPAGAPAPGWVGEARPRDEAAPGWVGEARPGDEVPPGWVGEARPGDEERLG